ncbi:hypothetical protein F5148DRAFT_1165810 [Russula earlei]|uniref:Uncharacterized protein n=1 Tax=Russula earlei TaxID=71964 RepID=A0ACC0UL73_9AGAM|nr:hypothetical protein F5148DRAFT_1165810 [Russula earlei]
MVKPPPPLTLSDVHDNNLSELDSISDSDWLDISASEDAGSIGILESDRDEGEDRPFSRRSYSSRSSSRDGDVDIWEGLVESTDDEAPEEPPEFSLRPSPLSMSTYAAVDGYSAEERRVEDALNQSMISTLSTSRASSMSASGTANHPPTRPRDLRLSFPDPLSGSKDDLLRSHEEPCSSPTTVDAPQLSELSDDEELPQTPLSSPSFLLKLPTVEFEIYLYGTPPEHKWSIVESLLEKWGATSNCTVSKRHPQSQNTSLYWLHTKGNLHRLSLGSAVSVIDNTDAQSVVGVALPYSLTVDVQLHQSNTEPILDKQSLAIVFLPTYLPSLPSHTLFLPVVASSSRELVAAGLDERERQVYEQQWSIFEVPKKQHLFPNAATILAGIDVDRMEASEVVQAFEPLQPLRRKIFRGIKNQVVATPALTIVAILSIVLGYIVSRFMPLPVATAPFAEKADSVNKSAVNISEHLSTSFMAPMSSAISLSPMRDISIVIASTSSSSLSTNPTGRRGSLKGTEELRMRDEKLMSVAVTSGSKSLVISQQSPSSLSEVSIRSKALAVFHQATEKSMHMPTEKAPTVTTRSRAETMYSLSTRLASSLSEMFNVKVLAGVLRADMQELLDALDELLQVLSRQVASAVHVTEGLRDQVRRRNRHAQQRARALREKGERMVSSLSERARGHVARARSQARALKDSISTEVATVCKKHQEGGLIQKMRKRQRGQSRKLRNSMRRVVKGRMGF